MICKICNATIDDNAASCPFCGTPVTVDVDPNNAPAPDTSAVSGSTPGAFPDPAASAAPVNDTPNTSDLGLSEPAQPYSDPMASQNAQPNQPYMDEPGNIPNGQAVPPNFNQAAQPNYSQNSYSQPDYSQNSYDQNNYGGYQSASPDLEAQAGSIQTLGIVALIVAIVIGSCCCVFAGPGVGIAGLVKYNKIKDSLYLLSPEGQKKANLGRILSIIAIVLGAIGFLINIVLVATGTLEEFTSSLS